SDLIAASFGVCRRRCCTQIRSASIHAARADARRAFKSEAFSLITQPNFGFCGGSCLPVMMVVASDEPGTPVTCRAIAEVQPRAIRDAPASMLQLISTAE